MPNQIQGPKPPLSQRDIDLLIGLASLSPGTSILSRGLLPETSRRGILELGAQADTGVRAAANTLTFHGADHLQAATDALFERPGGEAWSERYEHQLSTQRQLNARNASDRPFANMVGQAGGAVAGIALVAPEWAAVKVAPRLAGAAHTTAREYVALLGGGGAMGAGTQAAVDIATGRRFTLGDNVGAVLGSVAGAATLPLGPGSAGAIDGWATSIA